jgi:hypothetical protein
MDIVQVHGGSSVRYSQWELMLCDPVIALTHMDTVRTLLDTERLTGPILMSWDDMARAFAEDTMQLWMGRHEDEALPCCFMITEIRIFPLGRICFILLVGGKNLWPIARSFFPRFLDYCQSREVDFIETTTKPGVVKLLKRLGFQPTGVRCTRPLVTYN